MFGSHKDDDLANSEDPQDNGGFVSTAHPDPTGVPEPPAPGALAGADAGDTPAADAPAPEVTAPEAPAAETPAASDDTSDSPDEVPKFGQPFTPGSILPAAQNSDGPDDSPVATAASDTPAVSDDLINLKKEALQQLTPLVGHLDQSPEERFKTTMMMIQASDDQSLIQKAYEAAQEITDDKAKAQALLDIVNEINYFTQPH